ncbi:MAG: RsmE family RNA methyltransferase [Myxococcales bacterium FL481]|nr:MAG: RsmE family RNA methyltransferase [Myxococcales bacterium FL481]
MAVARPAARWRVASVVVAARGRGVSVRVFVRVDAAPRPGAVLSLDHDEHHYLARVRRVRPGQAVEALDLRGQRWQAAVEAIDAKQASIRLVRSMPTRPAPPSVAIIGLPSPAAALDAVARCCELGVEDVLLVRCELSQVGPPSDARTTRVLRASQRQCGRPREPRVQSLSLAEALAFRGEIPLFVGERDADVKEPRLDHARSGFRVAVGPEGGFSVREQAQLRDGGAIGLQLGPWTLRTEVAIVAACSRLAAAAERRPHVACGPKPTSA